MPEDRGALLVRRWRPSRREPPAGRGGAQRPRDHDHVARSRARPRDRATRRHLARHASRPPSPRARARGSRPPGCRAYSSQASRIPPNSSIDPRPIDRVRQGQRAEREPRRGRHRGDVADVHRDRLVPDVARRGRRPREVGALDEGVGREDQLPRAGATTAASSPTPTITSGPVPERTRRIAASSSCSDDVHGVVRSVQPDRRRVSLTGAGCPKGRSVDSSRTPDCPNAASPRSPARRPTVAEVSSTPPPRSSGRSPKRCPRLASPSTAT